MNIGQQEWDHCGLPINQFKLTKLPRGQVNSHEEFSVAESMYSMRKSPKKTKEQHEADCRKMAEASLRKKEAEAMRFQEPSFDLD